MNVEDIINDLIDASETMDDEVVVYVSGGIHARVVQVHRSEDGKIMIKIEEK